MARYDTNPGATLTTSFSAEEQVTAFLRAVYGWMCAGLAITAMTAWFIAASRSLIVAIATSRPLFWGLVIAQLGIVFVLSARVQQLAASTGRPARLRCGLADPSDGPTSATTHSGCDDPGARSRRAGDYFISRGFNNRLASW